LIGKVALVTGSSRGIGAACVKALAGEGASVVINYRQDERGARRVLEEIRSCKGNGIIVQADVSKEEDVRRMIRQTEETSGKVDILVNNAVAPPLSKGFLDTTWEEVQRDIDVIVKGAMQLCQMVLPGMIEKGQGRIINIGSTQLSYPTHQVHGYSIAKGALLALSRALAVDFGRHGVTVNYILVGYIETDIHDRWGVPKAVVEHQAELQAIKRIGTPDDVAAAVVFFASESSSFLTGCALHVSGGKQFGAI
jgi:3-oxoacyl-[acyl-carrier protein] reductase